MAVIHWNRSLGWNIELNRMKITHIITNGCDCYDWREVFAWWPVKTVTGLRAWGVKVYKRKVWVVWGTGFHMEPHVQYATLFEILSDAKEEKLNQ